MRNERAGLFAAVVIVLFFLCIAIANMNGCNVKNDPILLMYERHEAQAQDLNRRVKILEHQMDSIIMKGQK